MTRQVLTIGSRSVPPVPYRHVPKSPLWISRKDQRFVPEESGSCSARAGMRMVWCRTLRCFPFVAEQTNFLEATSRYHHETTELVKLRVLDQGPTTIQDFHELLVLGLLHVTEKSHCPLANLGGPGH